MIPTPAQPSSDRSSPRGTRCVRSRTAVRIGAFAMAGGVIAALIWMKLKVVGGVPRTAYADPEEERPSAATQPVSPAQAPSPGRPDEPKGR